MTPERIGSLVIEERISAGGMGEVYRAFDERLERRVAVKLIHSKRLGEESSLRRFRREARTLARLRHPSVVVVFGLETWDGGDALVMELLAGQTLSKILRRGLPSIRRAVEILRNVAEGLAFIHQNGVLHRDLKPSNIMLENGQAKLIDFGLAKPVRGRRSSHEEITETGQVWGTPGYMPPEQLLRLETDTRSDLFSFGVIAYLTLTGHPPFQGPKLEQQVLAQDPPPPHELGFARGTQAIPLALSRLVMALLSKDPAERPASAAAVIQHLSSPSTDLFRQDQDPGSIALVSTASHTESRSSGCSARSPGNQLRLRTWRKPRRPEQPYPVLLPYRHPDLLAGREREVAKLCRLLTTPIPILGLHAVSGAGKSSVLAAGLVPRLRAEGVPVAWTQYPAEPELPRRLVGDLVIVGSEQESSGGMPPLEDTENSTFIEFLSLAQRRSNGVPPVLVIDQFEQLLKPANRSQRACLGRLLSATSTVSSSLDGPICRWLLAYRQEYHGELSLWLRDVLAGSQATETEDPPDLVRDLSGAEVFHAMELRPLGSSLRGASLNTARRAFQAAIEQPLLVKGQDGARFYPWRIAKQDAERLAAAFAEARVAHPEAPLTPELQVVLAHLLASSEGCRDTKSRGVSTIRVPPDPGRLIDEALEDHLRRALESAFPNSTSAEETSVGQRRARALLALRELADRRGSKDEGISPAELSRAVGPGGEAVVEQLATPMTRLVVLSRRAGGWRYRISHDRMSEVVIRVVDHHGGLGDLEVDSKLLDLRRLIVLEKALFRSADSGSEPILSDSVYRRLEDNAEALVWDEESRRWWQACRDAKRAARQRRKNRLAAGVLSLLAVLAVIGFESRQAVDQSALLERVASSEPEEAWVTFLDRLRDGVEPSQLLERLTRRDAAMDLLALGLGAIEEPARSDAVLETVESALPWVEQAPGNLELVANLAWALDYSPGRREETAEQARDLRDRVLHPLRSRYPPPAVRAAEDPDWVEIPAGTFFMGSRPDEESHADEYPRHRVSLSSFRMLRHEVTVGEFRRLVPNHHSGRRPDVPAVYVDWYAAYAYSAWLGGRLPTEAEWEYAARADCEFSHCDRNGSETSVETVAWILCNATSPSGDFEIQPVMQLEPNAWGLFDMLGNVWEWTADGFASYPPEDRQDPWVRQSPGKGRVDRGASVTDEARGTRAGNRSNDIPSGESPNRGFRVVLLEDRAVGSDSLR